MAGMRLRNAGMSVLELLIVLGIFAIIVGIGWFGGSALSRRTAAEGAVATFQQSVWQGATAAAARGLVVDLVRTDAQLLLINVNTDEVLRAYDFPAEATISVENPILRFLPPGKVDLEGPNALPEDLVITSGDRSYQLDVSLIGEVRAERTEE